MANEKLKVSLKADLKQIAKTHYDSPEGKSGVIIPELTKEMMDQDDFEAELWTNNEGEEVYRVAVGPIGIIDSVYCVYSVTDFNDKFKLKVKNK